MVLLDLCSLILAGFAPRHETFNQGVMGSNPIGLTNVINNLRLLLPRFFARPEAHRKHQAGNSTRLRCKGFTQIDRFPVALCLPHPESQTGASCNGASLYGEGLGREGSRGRGRPSGAYCSLRLASLSLAFADYHRQVCGSRSSLAAQRKGGPGARTWPSWVRD